VTARELSCSGWGGCATAAGLDRGGSQPGTHAEDRECADALPVFVSFYDRRRRHTAPGGQSPLDAVDDASGSCA